MATVVVTPTAAADLAQLITTHSLPPDTRRISSETDSGSKQLTITQNA